MTRSLIAVGDVTNPNTWSGTPYHYWQAAKKSGFITHPVALDLQKISWQRYTWNFAQLLAGQRSGGFQYSSWFAKLIESQLNQSEGTEEYLSFNQFVPRASFAKAKRARCSYYIDATMTDLLKSYKLADQMAGGIAKRALERERENLAECEKVVAFQRWAAESVINDCGISKTQVATILPGANLILPGDFQFSDFRSGCGIEHPFRLCFIGKEWERKGLPFLAEVRRDLERRGLNVTLCVIGGCPDALKNEPGVDYQGFINKNQDMNHFISVVKSCDMGCLFSTADASSIAVLEFLRLGLPVAGFVVDGMGDLLPPDASLRFDPQCPVKEVADHLEALIRDQQKLHEMRATARCWSPLVSWERCIGEFEELWKTSTIKKPVRPWLGLSEQPAVVVP